MRRLIFVNNVVFTIVPDRPVSHGSIASIFEFLAPGLAKSSSPPTWPPDAFALCAAVLYYSGCYTLITNNWPPPLPKTMPVSDRKKGWHHFIQTIGKRWASLASGDPERLPSQVREWWQVIYRARNVRLGDLAKEREVFFAIAQIVAVADEACAGVGLPYYGADKKKSARWLFKEKADDHLGLRFDQRRATLCKLVDNPLFQVLPKLHTPQSGLTLRSLTHHIAFCPAGEVSTRWITVASPRETTDVGSSQHSLNILLVPWPKLVVPQQFVAASPPRLRLRNMDERHYGFFQFQVDSVAAQLAELGSLYKKAQEKFGRIDGVVMPELAIPYEEIESVYNEIYESHFLDEEAGSPPFLVVGAKRGTGNKTENCAATLLAFPGEDEDYLVQIDQNKRHRWKLTGSQIADYGLGDRLDSTRDWWEDMSAEARELWFMSLRPWMTFCTLICEDLARPDPVADVIRTVGPNLVLALLMDGPQLQGRWSGRYATVLADDPGCSVLTLTSIGMASLSRPPGKPLSRVVALWKDSIGGAEEIELADDAEGVVLTLTREFRTECTADGRLERDRASYIRLTSWDCV